MKLLILAGGMSSRMKKPLDEAMNVEGQLLAEADTLPKGLIHLGVNGRPFLDYVVYNSYKAGYTDIIILVNQYDKLIQEYYNTHNGTDLLWGLTIRFAIQYVPEGRTKPLGTADAVLQTMNQYPEWAGSKFTVCNSDNLYTPETMRAISTHPYPCVFPGYNLEALQVETDKALQFGFVKTTPDGLLLAFVEKPSIEELEALLAESGSLMVSMNIFSFDYDTLKPLLEKTPISTNRNEKELPNTLKIMIEELPGSTYVFPVTEYVPDLTGKRDITTVQAYLKEHFEEI